MENPQTKSTGTATKPTMDEQILAVMMGFHMDGNHKVTLKDVATELGKQERTKSFRERWSILKNQKGYIGTSKISGAGFFELTPEGIEQAQTDEYKEKNPIWFPRLLTHGEHNNIGAQLYRSIEKTSDITFLIGTSTSRKEFKVHKCILELRAKSLYELILTEEESNSNNEDGNDSTIITLPDTEEKVFDVFLVFLYTGKEPELNKDDEDIAKSILHAANRFGCTDLKLYIESVLVDKILVPSNAIALLFLADSYSCALLKEAAMNMYASKSSDVMESSKEDWTRLKESNDLLVELLVYTNNSGGCKKYSSVVDNGDEDTLDDVDDFDVTSLRERLEKANLDVDGSRQMLVERWKTYLRTTIDDIIENQNKRQRIE